MKNRTDGYDFFTSALTALGEVSLDVFDALFPVVEPPPRQIFAPKRPQPRLPKPDPCPPPPKPEPPPAGFLIGEDRNSGKPIYVTDAELDRHMLLVGATGSGKTTLILRLFDEEVRQWR